MTRLDAGQTDEHVVLGKLTSPHGVKGWLKVYSYTNPIDGILRYPEWWVRQGQTLTKMPVIQGRQQGKALVVQLGTINDRTAAEALAQAEIVMPKQALPELADDEYYWHELEGLEVVTRSGERLGRIAYLFATGANDVMVVRGDDRAIDKRERLLPYLPGDVVRAIDLSEGRMIVDWDSEF